MKTINIAIDGPSGAGKSTLAKKIARDCGYIYVDTGALYRSIGYYMVKNNIVPSDNEHVIPALENLTVDFKHIDGVQHVFVNGEDVTGFIRTQEISMAASDVSAIPEVRKFLLDCQRNIAAENNVIMDGRDVGTVILPNADVKIFLCASAEVRAKRRYDELTAAGQECDYEETLRLIIERDANDSSRCVAPLRQADDAILLDNSDLDFDGTVEAVKNIISEKLGETK